MGCLEAMKKIIVKPVALVALSSAIGANAALIDRENGVIYDIAVDVTWLADMNCARTSGYEPDGLMRWSTANNWADDLVSRGCFDSRLPTVSTADVTCNSLGAGGERDRSLTVRCEPSVHRLGHD